MLLSLIVEIKGDLGINPYPKVVVHGTPLSESLSEISGWCKLRWKKTVNTN